MPEETKPSEQPITRQSAVADAVKQLASEEQSEEKPVVKEVKKEEEKPTEDQEELQEALKLYKALKNEQTRGSVIAFIAEQGGYVKKEAPTTKEEVKEVTSDLISSLKETVAPEFQFLIDQIAPGIEKYLKAEMQRAQADIRKTIEENELEKLNAQSERAFVKITSDFFGEGVEVPKAVTEEMDKLMDQIPASPDLSVKDYLSIVFNAAVGKLGLTKGSKTKQERTERNRSDAAVRLASERSTSTATVDASQPKSRRDAIRAAIESLGDLS